MTQFNSVYDLLQVISAPEIDPSAYPKMSAEYEKKSQELPIQMALYGELTLHEQAIFKNLQSLLGAHLPKLDKLFNLLGIQVENPDQLQDLIYQLKTGYVTVATKTSKTVDWDSMGRPELLEICKEAPLSLTDELVNLVTKYVSQWMDAGMTADGPLDALQQVFAGGDLIISKVEQKVVEGEALLTSCGLDWAQLYQFCFLVNPNLPAEVLIGLRTGATRYSLLSYLTASQAKTQLETLEIELSSYLKGQETSKEPVASNPNVEPESDGSGKEETVEAQDPSESTEDTQDTKESPKSES